LAEQVTLSSDVLRAVFWFIIVDHVKHVNGLRVCSLNATATLYMGDTILVVIIYIFSYFPWQKIAWWYVLLYFSYFWLGLSVQTNLCVVM